MNSLQTAEIFRNPTHDAVDGARNSPSTASLIGEIQHRLKTTGYRELRNLKISVFDGTVILRGTVSSYYLKQQAQDCLLRSPAVKRVINDVEVVWPDTHSQRRAPAWTFREHLR